MSFGRLHERLFEYGVRRFGLDRLSPVMVPGAIALPNGEEMLA